MLEYQEVAALMGPVIQERVLRWKENNCYLYYNQHLYIIISADHLSSSPSRIGNWFSYIALSIQIQWFICVAGSESP